jgi:hypothetical protein
MSQQAETRDSVPVQEYPWWALPLGLLLLALVLLVVQQRYAAPPPKGEDVPSGEFSAGRARMVLRDLLGDGTPHPLGSAAHARVRDHIVAALRRQGYTPEIQTGFACNERNVCGRVENVVALLAGREPGPAVMLAAHYDSVPGGPGAGDDMTGIAALLEIARILKSGPSPRHSIVLLADDGEEVGMLGAEVFVAEHPLARQVRAVVNLEGRGSSGPSLMFETSNGNAWLIRLYAAANRPVTSSVFETLYNRLPNRTDFTVFERSGIQGLNLAFIGDPAHYHTPLDSFANASPATLQHQGDNALAAMRELAGADLPERPLGNAVFFDVLSLGLVWWPEAWTPGIAVLAVLLLGSTVLLLRRGAVAGGSLVWGFVAWLVMVIASGAAGFGLSTVLGMAGVLRARWAAHPLPFEAAFWSIGLAAVGMIAALFSRRAGGVGMWVGVWLGWSVLGLLLAVTQPGISYLLVVPSLVAGLVGLGLSRRSPAGGALTAILPALVAAVLWFPLLTMLYEGIGAMILPVTALLAGFVFSSLAPLVPSASRPWRRGIPLAAAAAAAVCAVVAVWLPLYSADSPQLLSLVFHQDADTGKARWIVSSRSPLPPSLEKAAPFRKERVEAVPWSGEANAWIAEAPPLNVPGPELTVLADASAGGKRRLRIRLRSPRGAPNATLILPKSAKIESVTVQGHRVPAGEAGLPEEDWSPYFLEAMPSAGVEIDLVLGETAPQTWNFSDSNGGLPPAGAALSAARSVTMVPSHTGDVTLVGRQRRI